MSVHKDLTGADLHEPKGADTATSGKVYVSDGAGSGAWTTASDIITNTAFTTGDLKITHKSSADTGWIIWQEATIGDGSSGATLRANADTANLFALYWAFAAADCPIYTSAGAASTRGASAAADYAAHKRIDLPKGNCRALVMAGVATGLTSRTLGSTAGAETVTLTAAQIPSITSNASNNITVNYGGYLCLTSNIQATVPVSSAGSLYTTYAPSGAADWIMNQTASAATSNAISVTSNNTSGASHTNVQPSTFVNVMVKL